jgi:hypothetical protein
MREGADVQIDPDLPMDLVPIAWLIGTWQGVGVGGYPSIEDFRFGQELVFARSLDERDRHTGAEKPYLSYTSRSWLLDDDGNQLRPLAEEKGYWRVLPGAESAKGSREAEGAADSGGTMTPVEVLLTHPSGYVEIWDGVADGAKIELATDLVARSPRAKDYSAGHRLYGLVQGELLWAYDMAAVGHPLQSHLSARLRRA